MEKSYRTVVLGFKCIFKICNGLFQIWDRIAEKHAATRVRAREQGEHGRINSCINQIMCDHMERETKTLSENPAGYQDNPSLADSM